MPPSRTNGSRASRQQPSWAANDDAAREPFDDVEGYQNFWKSASYFEGDEFQVLIERIDTYNCPCERKDGGKFITVTGPGDELSINGSGDKTAATYARELAAVLVVVADAADLITD